MDGRPVVGILNAVWSRDAADYRVHLSNSDFVHNMLYTLKKKRARCNQKGFLGGEPQTNPFCSPNEAFSRFFFQNN